MQTLFVQKYIQYCVEYEYRTSRTEYLHRNKYSKVFTCIVLIHTNTTLHHIATKKSVFITTKRCFYVKISIKLYKEEQVNFFLWMKKF